jgi:hypothetical protein
MNDQLIEQVLRKAPAPKAPADLEEKLIANIRLPRKERVQTEPLRRSSWFKRWLPGLSFGASTVACLAIIGVQVNQLSELRRQNDALRTQTQDLAVLREANAEVQRLRNENAELDRLRKDAAEIQSLREKIAPLRAQADALAQLRAENQRLRTAAAAAPGAPKDFFADMKERADRISCVNNLKQLGLAARIWANDHDGKYPADFISITNEIGQSLKILQCRGDHSHEVTSWAQVAAGNVSYRIYTAGLTETDNPNIIAFECPLHRNICLLDGSVQQLSERGFKEDVKIVDGRKVWVPPASAPTP